MSNPANVVFLIHPASLQSFGELQYALAFAQDIESAGYRPWFVTTEGVAQQLRGAKCDPLIFDSVDAAKALIEEIDPSIVIACEIFGMPEESIAMLETLDTKIATIDATTLGVEIASDPFLDGSPHRTLPERFLSFRPCPLNEPGIDTETELYCAAFPDVSRVPRSAARYVKLGLDPSRRTVLLPIAPWAQYFAQLPEAPFTAFRDHHAQLVRKIARGLSLTGDKTQLVVISKTPAAAHRERSVLVHSPGLIAFDDYEHLLLSCDLVVSDNIIQASIAKAVAAGIPHLVIQNTNQSAEPYPWNVFPLRRMVPSDREFARVVEVAEWSDDDDLAEKLVAISQRGHADLRRRVLRRDYSARVAALPAFAEVLERVVGRSGSPAITRREQSRNDSPSIVFYLEIWFSFGEREHALALATQFQRAGYRPRFVVDHRVADHIRAAGFEAVVFYTPQMGVEAVRKIDPVLIIGCELFNLSEESVRGLISLGKPMATVDGTSLGVPINTDPFGHPKLTRNLTLPESYWSFRPSPVNDPGPDTDDVFHYNPFAGERRIEKDDDVYASIGLDAQRKTVMLPIAMWARTSASLFELGSYHAMLVDRVASGLEASGERVDLLVVGLPPSADAPAHERVRTIFIEKLPYPTYNHILTSCDAIVADNIIQTSVSKAFVMGTPHLIIQNLEESEIPFRCNIFPLKVLFPLDREYGRSVEVAEFGDVECIREKLAAVITDGYFDEDRRRRREDFLARLGRLRDPSEALERILSAQARSVAG